MNPLPETASNRDTINHLTCTDHPQVNHKLADPTEGRTVLIKVPASTANLGPGFDSLGLALELYAWIGMSAAPQTKINLHGEQTAGLPVDKNNLLYTVAQQVFVRAGVAVPELEISIYSDIPLTRGLGSSAAAIVGALAAANELIGNPLALDELFQMASAIEKHPDNVGASLFGGMVVAFWDGVRAEYIRVEPDSRLETVVAIPDFQLSTEKARKVIPQTLALKDAVYNIGHSNLLVAALCTGHYASIRLAMKDVIHQPYRAALIPGMLEVLAGATEHGALGAALSGAGPTLIALVDSEEGRKNELEQFLTNTLLASGTRASLQWLKPSLEGVRLLTHSGDHLTFMKAVGKEGFV